MLEHNNTAIYNITYYKVVVLKLGVPTSREVERRFWETERGDNILFPNIF